MSPERESDPRPLEQRREHYEVERQLAERLQAAPREQRRRLYRTLYEELFRRVPHHPQFARKATPEQRRAMVQAELRFLRPFLRPGIAFLEIGAGDCALSFEVARSVDRVVAVDVSDEITRSETRPPNFELRLTDGCTLSLPEASVDVVYSQQVMEHLHPEDAADQLSEIRKALRPGGVFVCVTPNRLTGPHDVSGEFDQEARGFHLKEYTSVELARLFREAGFSRVTAVLAGCGRFVRVPLPLFSAIESCWALLPRPLRRAWRDRFPFRALFLNVQLVGSAPSLRA